MAVIELRDVCKAFGSNRVIEHLTLRISDGSFTVLLGPSGCGKTTLLRMIAGIGRQTSGQILIDSQDISDLPPSDRDIAMVFQNYALYPNMTVKENIEFGLINNKVPKARRETLIRNVTEIVGLSEYLKRMPSTLSGGQRQRVALARAIVKEPKVFLMDEPLSNLDAKLRVSMRTELIELHKKLQTNFVYVTHDQVEAMSMADHIILMNQGKVMQQGSPETIYRDPDNIFTAQFIGTPPMNVLPMEDGLFVGFRPEKVRLWRDRPKTRFHRFGRVHTREMLGSETLYKVAAGSEAVMVKSLDDGFGFDEELYAGVEDDDLYFFDGRQERIRTGTSELMAAAQRVQEHVLD